MSVLKIQTFESNFDRNIFNQVAEHERREYGKGHFREALKLKRFAKKFPEGFVVLTDESNVVVGAADFYPLEPEAWQSLADGLTVEENLPSDAVMRGSSHLYIASIIVAQPSRASFVGTPVMFRALMRQLWGEMAGQDGGLKVLGVGSTEKGKILLGNCGCKPRQNVEGCLDARPRYVLEDPSRVLVNRIATKYNEPSASMTQAGF